MRLELQRALERVLPLRLFLVMVDLGHLAFIDWSALTQYDTSEDAEPTRHDNLEVLAGLSLVAPLGVQLAHLEMAVVDDEMIKLKDRQQQIPSWDAAVHSLGHLDRDAVLPGSPSPPLYRALRRTAHPDWPVQRKEQHCPATLISE